MRTTLLAIALALLFAHEASAQFTVVSKLTDEATLAPGDARSGVIRIQSTSSEPLKLVVYQRDHFVTAENGLEELAPGSLSRSNAPWIQVSSSSITVPPRQMMDIAYRLVVPTDLSGTLSGTYWSRIYVESDVPPKPMDGPEEGRFMISQSARYALQVITHIAGTGAAEIAFDTPTLVESENGEQVLQVDVENAGTRMTKPAVWVEVYDESGELAGRYDGYAHRLYPGTSARQRIIMDGIADGSYRLLLVADDGGDRLFGAQYDLSF